MWGKVSYFSHLRRATLICVISFALTGLAYANAGIDSVAGTDLPISAGGIPAMTVSGTNGDVIVNKNISANSYAIPGVSEPMNSTKLTSLNNLSNLPACPSGKVLTKDGATTFDCVSAALGAESSVGGSSFPTWSSQATDCPDGSVVVGILVTTHGTCGHNCDGDGPIVAAIQLHCRTLQ